MLVENKLKILQELVDTSSPDELLWINGYLNGIVKIYSDKKLPEQTSTAIVKQKFTILYGTETGNSKRLATDFALKAKRVNIQTKVIGMDQYRLSDLAKEEILLTVVSTHGEGEPPAAAKKFYDHIHNNGFKLNRLKFSVLALGDTAYPLFCKTGEEIDEQLAKLGANRIAPLQRCDLDFDADAAAWFNSVLHSIESKQPAVIEKQPEVTIKKTGKQKYAGTVLSNIILNDKGSLKETYHIEFAAEGVEYSCGDSIGIVPVNPDNVVEEIIQLAKADAAKPVLFNNETITIGELLKHKVNILHLTERLVSQYAAIVQSEIPAGKMDLCDLLIKYPLKSVADFEQFICKLNPLSPRLYTIASSPAAHPDEIHVVVAKDMYHVNQRKRFGLCSSFLGDLKINQDQSFFIQPNKRFRLPADDKDIIMVGPGTGIAAFRSFLAEREANGATGRNWLFFGEQHFATDFLYQTELQNWFDTGLLTKINLAFSRDQEQKIYVQHKMQEHGAELYEWLQGGGYFFICGKKDPVSIDVEKALIDIIEKFGNKSNEEAVQYLHTLEESGRYEKDVY